MDLATLIALLENVGLLSLGAILTFIILKRRGLQDTGLSDQVALGIIFGAISLIVVQVPIRSILGATFDTRAAPLVLSGLYAGPVGTLIAASIAAIARYNVGGPAAIGGMVSCFLYVVIGFAAKHVLWRDQSVIGAKRLLILALAATIFVLPSFFIGQTFERGLAILQRFWPVLLVGNLLGISLLGLMLDQLSALVQERNAIKLAEQTTLLARNAANVGIWRSDFRAKSLVWDDVQRRILGYEREASVIARDAFRKAVHPEDLPKLSAAFESARRDGRRFDHRFRIIRPSGDIRQIHAIADFVGGVSGDPDSAIGVNIDETDERRLLEEVALKSAAIDAASCGDVLPVFSAIWDESFRAGRLTGTGRPGTMKKSRYTEEQIAYALRQAETGTPVAEVLRKMGISEQTFYRWKKLYGGMGVAEVRRLKQLEEENAKLKRLVADLSLDKIMLQDVVRSKL